MGEFIRKTITGFRTVPETDATHYIQTVQEYRQEINRFRSAINEYSGRLSAGEREISSITAEYKRRIAELENSHKFETDSLKSEIEAYKKAVSDASEKAESACRQYDNMLRIMRERSNSARGITPKKQHDGYVITFCRQTTDFQVIKNSWEEYQKMPAAYKKKNRFITVERNPVPVWQLSVQTPFDISINVQEFEPRILSELKNGLLKDVGCSMISESNGPLPSDLHTQLMYRWNYIGDLKARIWLIEIYLTHCPAIPPSRLS